MFVFFFKQKTAYEISACLVGSEMCIRDRSWPGLLLRVPSLSSPPKELYNPRAFITHAAWLDQACAHCPIFPTAASRRSLGRVSVPVWLIVLSDQLRIVALVSRYLTNKLIRRGLILSRRPKLPFLTSPKTREAIRY